MKSEKLTPAQAAAEMGVSPQTLANWRWQGIGPAYIKLTPGRGGRIRYTRAAVEAWLRERTTGAAA
ncbi:helix-turn-helix domain-containing protein [Streptomyces sp. S07_1.15]|uniref:helix-turn-helix domain-containing protein n=1 Tax=Streptomyces sp. S07_1.15 TaxID=2873925 RepID=UPI001D15D90F|nr:helix-turn-helix domain-containing protein [Streptomyces sp. S07_1.15]MCC3653215.1 helix-turn-helix domain-containing protein [Streptomyces sp. S07_1.15]